MPKEASQHVFKNYSWLVKKLFTLDTRSLGFFRILVAILVLTDLAARMADINVFYTDNGVFPRQALYHAFDPWFISIHSLSGSVCWQIFLFILAGIFAVALLIGYRTRVATFVSWFLLMSLQHRNPLLNQGGDDLLRLLLFWSIFLPLERSFSLDNLLKPVAELKKNPLHINSVATFAYYIQIISLYLVAYATKIGIEWHKDGTAIYYALSTQERATFFTPLLLHHEVLMRLLTHGTMLLELFGPLLFFIPVLLGPLRTLLVFIFIGFHLGMGVFLRLGPFPCVAATAFVPFFPEWFWQKVSLVFSSFKAKKPQVSLYYDLDCGFCENISQSIKKYFIFARVSIIPAQSDKSMLDKMLKHNSWILVDEKEKAHYKFDGVIALAKLIPVSPLFTFILKLPLIYKTGNFLYEFIAVRRHSFCVLPTGRQNMYRIALKQAIVELFVGFMCIYGLFWNLGTAVSFNTPAYNYVWFAELIGLNQNWNMFAPSPPLENDWYVIQGILSNGKTFDLLRQGKAVSWDKPISIAQDYSNERWLNYMDRLTSSPLYSKYFSRYECLNWNKFHYGGEVLKIVSINYVKTSILLHGIYGVPQRKHLMSLYCDN